MIADNDLLLRVRDLKVHFPTADGLVKAVDGISFEIRRGQTLGVVGESGSGKSVSFLTIMGLITSRQAQISGEVIFKGRDLLTLPVEEMRHIRGKEMGMVFQDPMTSLHPMYRVGDQIAEAVLTHQETTKKAAAAMAVDMLGRVGISKPAESARRYPHEFSGGMRQRAMIAMSLVLNPDLLIADEPTTALDVTVQAQILDLIDRLKSEFNAAVAIITHDLGVVAEHCDDIQVMYAGRIVETGTNRDLFYRGRHPYTWGLLQSIPRLDAEESHRLHPIKGLPPSLIFVPPGCSFHPRCPYAFDRCRTEEPRLASPDGYHASACHLSDDDKERIFNEKVLNRT
ncbi:MAG: ABC transporter ATP-binding protein [Acidimicrobiia bacterium]|nr:ABC transporter ATP-binding protein [Acidimicrobiia bacterium]